MCGYVSPVSQWLLVMYFADYLLSLHSLLFSQPPVFLLLQQGCSRLLPSAGAISGIKFSLSSLCATSASTPALWDNRSFEKP